MKDYDILYEYKNNAQFVQKSLYNYLVFQVYSVPVIREAHKRWSNLFDGLRDNTPKEIAKIIEKAEDLSNEDIQYQLNRYWVDNAIQTLKQYQNCAVPLTNDLKVDQTTRKLTSPIGDQNLKTLQFAKDSEQYTDKMADLAIRCAHKFLFDDKNYRTWYISPRFADALAIPHRKDEWNFPVIQLTKGCPNHCSHCCSRAEAHLSHMPWPVFVNLYRGFYKHYKHYPQKTVDHYFAQFFSDSDMLTYYDPIMKSDSGDAALFITCEGDGFCNVMTRGVRDDRSKLALKKVIISGQPIALSFVDTPKENMKYNQQQLSDTLDIIQKCADDNLAFQIIHLHLKSGPTVSDEIFRGFPVMKTGIWAVGRGKEFPDEETEHEPDESFTAPFVIQPNGDICSGAMKNGEHKIEKFGSLYGVHGLYPTRFCWKRIKHCVTQYNQTIFQKLRQAKIKSNE